MIKKLTENQEKVINAARKHNKDGEINWHNIVIEVEGKYTNAGRNRIHSCVLNLKNTGRWPFFKENIIDEEIEVFYEIVRLIGELKENQKEKVLKYLKLKFDMEI